MTEELNRSTAQFFFEIGFGNCFAEAMIRNDMKPPFEFSDALVEGAWPRAIEAHEDGAEMDRYLKQAEAADRLAHLPTDLSEERAIETLRSVAKADGWTEINIESECWQTALRAMQRYAAGLQGEVERLRAIAREAEFLCARIDELDWCDLDDTARQHAGHVDPSHSRLKGLLAALGDSQ